MRDTRPLVVRLSTSDGGGSTTNGVQVRRYVLFFRAATVTSATPHRVRIALADDHLVVRAGLRRLLEDEPDWTVVAEAGTLDEALSIVARHKPDVLVLDLNLGDRSSVGALPDFLARSPDTRVLVLTMHTEPAYARNALHAGATGYVLKEAAETDLVAAIRAAAAGQQYVTPRVRDLLQGDPDTTNGDGLSRRERDVLRLLALGYTNAEIAEQLFISNRTVETHRGNLQRKLGVNTRAGLTSFALERGLLHP